MGWKVPPLEMVSRMEPCAGTWAAEEPGAATAIIGTWIHHGVSIGTRSDMAVIKKPENGYENISLSLVFYTWSCFAYSTNTLPCEGPLDSVMEPVRVMTRRERHGITSGAVL